MKNKITNRTQVYRAIYYSGFDWTKTKTGNSDSYKLVSKDENHTIYVEHQLSEDKTKDILVVKGTDQFTEKELARFKRLCQKIMRRTRDLEIQQELVELTEGAKDVQE